MNLKTSYKLLISMESKCLECEIETEIIHDSKNGQMICLECGTVLEEHVPDERDEGTRYENDSGICKDLTRHGYTDGFNPHDTLGTFVPRGTFVTITKADGTTYRKDLSKLNMIVSQTSKEKSYNNMVKVFDKLMYDRAVHSSVVESAKHIWGDITVANDIIYRGRNLRGILASCVLYSSYKTENPMERDTVCEIMECSKKDLSNGEPIFRTLVQKSKSKHILDYSYTERTAKMFTKIIFDLGLDYSYVGKCVKMYQTTRLKTLKEKSIIAGIVWENTRNVKGVTKIRVSQLTGVSVPTMNKAHEKLLVKLMRT